MMSEATRNAISSPGSGAGPTPCDSLDGMTLDLFGQPLCPANPSRQPGKAKATATRAICGPHSTGSSASRDLSESLANRLKRRLGSGGSTEYSLTWRDSDTPAGRRFYLLRASGRRTSDTGCIGWPTARAEDSESTGAHRGTLDTLTSATRLAGWPTPRTPTGGPESAARKQELGRTESGGGDLASVAILSGWPPATTRDWRDGRASDATMDKNARPLNEVVQQHGPTPDPSSAATESTAGFRLNPLFSLWLMGYNPAAWASCAERVTQSCRRLRRRS